MLAGVDVSTEVSGGKAFPRLRAARSGDLSSAKYYPRYLTIHERLGRLCDPTSMSSLSPFLT